MQGLPVNLSSPPSSGGSGSVSIPFQFTEDTDSASVRVGTFAGDRATPADGDTAYLTLALSDDAGNQDEQARIEWSATTVADGATQDGQLACHVLVNNSLTEVLRMAGATPQISTFAELLCNDAVTIALANDADADCLVLRSANDTAATDDAVNLIYQASTSSTANVEIAQIQAVLTNTSHASRRSDLVFYCDMDASGTLSESLRLSGEYKSIQINRTGSDNARLFLGAAGTGDAAVYLDASDGDGAGADYLIIKQNNDKSVDFFTGANANGDIRFWADQNATPSNIPLTLLSGSTVGDVQMSGSTDTELFYIDASADKIGICTSAPESTLHIAATDGIYIGGGSAADFDIIVLDEGSPFASGPKISWDDSETAIRLENMDGIDIGNGGRIYGNATNRYLTMNSSNHFIYYASGQNRFRADAGGGVGTTCMMVFDIDNSTLERVSVGAADSGGSGYKVLRIPN